MISSNIFRNYDVRGEFGIDLTLESAYKIAKAFVEYAKPKTVVVGGDIRLSTPMLKEQIIKGLLEMGVEVVDIGLVSTDTLYFACNNYKFDGGLMVTASHMPKKFNGIKFLRLNEKRVLSPIGKGLGMEELEQIAQNEDWVDALEKGTVKKKDVLDDFVKYTQSFIDVQNLKPFKIVMDAGNGMAGPIADRIFAGFGFDITKLYFNPDGNFPNHPANPIEEENRRDLVKKVKEVKADLGIAWDADCDRVYFIDETGNYINGDFITALLAIGFLDKNPGSGIVYDLRASRVVKDLVEKKGGKAYMERVGHTYIKKRMQDTNAVFGGEISGHYYFARNSYLENGFAPALMVLELMSKTNKKLSEIINGLGNYYVSGEINFTVKDIKLILKIIKEKYQNAKEILEMDGLSFEFDNWRFNVRPSSNDPVLRLNLEANSKELMKEKLAELTNLIES